ncbi:MAG TPA: ATP-binding protein [Trebonia sp.]
MIAYLASMIRCAGIVYILVQVVIWHSFYTAAWWRLAALVLAVVWSATVAVYLRRHWPSPFLACVDSAVYVALAVSTQACVPPLIRDSPCSWLVIGLSGQLIIPAWYAPVGLSAVLALSSPLAYLTGAALQPVTDPRTLIGSAVLLLAVGIAHGAGRHVLYVRAAEADADLDLADRAARAQYAVLSRNIERGEHERLLHDTVLNTLTALARRGGERSEVMTRCRQDVALMEAALGADEVDPDAARAADDLRGHLRAVVAGMRARGLTVHCAADDAAGAAVPARVGAALANVVREALSNVATHAGTGEAWVSLLRPEPERGSGAVEIVVRDRGAGFDLARVDQTRLGLRRSISERTAECGGHASIESEPGRGTVISLSWPAPGSPDASHPADGMLLRGGLPW